MKTIADYQEDIESVRDYYADLLIMQYHSMQRARETVKLGADIYMGDGLAFQLQDVLDIDTANGKQLDIIGKILDCNRIVQGLSTDLEYFEFDTNSSQADHKGFSQNNNVSSGFFKSKAVAKNHQSIYSLNDEDYRILLKFKACANSARGSWAGIDKVYYQAFGNYLYIINNKDLTITYIIDQSLGQAVIAAEMLGYLEPPCGVGYKIWHLPQLTFGFNNKNNNSKAVGFSTKNKIIDGTFITKDNIT